MPMEHLVDAVRKFSQCQVAVLGDLMLDRYTFGEATRISQEAPVPVVLVGRHKQVPGGAANVVRNVIALNARSATFGIVGTDAAGEELRRLLEGPNEDGQGVLVRPDCITTVKTRVLASNQQVVRIDEEQPGLVTDEIRSVLLKQLEDELSRGRCKALIMEDYAKGVFTASFMEQAVAVARKHGVFATLDPHPSHGFDVKGLHLMTPNRSEAFALAKMPYVAGINDPVHDEALLEVGRVLRRRWDADLQLITLGAEGMALFTRDEELPVHIPTRAQRVFDVSGAGDTVMATMTLALLTNISPREAAEIANYAAGIVVGYVGTRAIEAPELIAKLQSL